MHIKPQELSLIIVILEQSRPTEPNYLDVSTGVDLVDGVTGSSSRFSVQVVALHKDSVVAQAAHPHITLPLALQLHSFSNVEPVKRDTRSIILLSSRSTQTQKNSHTPNVPRWKLTWPSRCSLFCGRC